MPAIGSLERDLRRKRIPMFGQTFDIHDLAIIALLVVLEGVLSIDNALVLGLLARRLPRQQQKKALTYGLIGAFVFRFIAIATASYLLHWRIVKLIGGGYLVYVAVKHFLFDNRAHSGESVTVDGSGKPVLADAEGKPLSEGQAEARLAEQRPTLAKAGAGLWPTVMVIELTDIAFAVDSIVAAIGVVGPPPPGSQRHDKLWVVLIGGFIGVVLMRFAAVLFIRLLERFPRFETAAYLLVILIGLKLVVDWAANSEAHPHRINFHEVHSPAFWIFWTLMALCFCVGFLPSRGSAAAAAKPH
jgi:YkoY family integral membrane protein